MLSHYYQFLSGSPLCDDDSATSPVRLGTQSRYYPKAAIQIRKFIYYNGYQLQDTVNDVKIKLATKLQEEFLLFDLKTKLDSQVSAELYFAWRIRFALCNQQCRLQVVIYFLIYFYMRT
jgi:hypothetical protein